jgi:large subunit ribosomal protein L9
MRVILKEDLESLGKIGEVVTVRSGYARNFLIPKALCVVANESNRKELDHHKRILEKKREKVLAAARLLAAAIGKLHVTIEKQAGEENRIFGSVTTLEVAEKLAAQSVVIERRQIHLPEDIKKLGIYQAEIKVHSEVSANLVVKVVAKEG